MSQPAIAKLSWAQRAVKAAAGILLRPMMERALVSGELGGVERALRWGADPNGRVFSANTPLTAGALGLRKESSSIPHAQIERAIKERAELLIAWGADVNKADGFGNRPLRSAMAQCSVGLCEALALAGADPDLPNAKGEVARECARDHAEYWQGMDFTGNISVIEKKEAVLAALDLFTQAHEIGKSAAPSRSAARSARRV